MSPDDFKKWRNMLKLTQVAAGELLGVSRVTVQNWESAVTRMPVAVDAACELHQLRWKMRPDFGPVTLTHFDAPLWQATCGPISIPRGSKELYPDNASAIKRACELRGKFGIHNLLISDESGDIVWNSAQLEQECERRKANGRKSAGMRRAT